MRLANFQLRCCIEIEYGQVSRTLFRYLRWVLSCLVATPAVADGDGEPLLLHQDLQALLSPTSLAWAGTGVAAAVLVQPWDDQIHFGLSDWPTVRATLDVVDLYGSNRHVSITLVAAWSGAKLLGNDFVASSTSEMLRAVVFANVLVTPLKFAVGRRRPDGSNSLSFPSGHSANAFALTTALGRRLRPFPLLILYAATVAVPVSRIHHHQHFLSDVVSGSVLGIVAGRAVTPVVGARPSGTRKLAYGPITAQGNLGLGIWLRFP